MARRVKLCRSNGMAESKTERVCLHKQTRSVFQKKEPINRVPGGYGLSALRLCVWLFDNCCMKLLYLNDRFVLAPRTKQRKVFKDRVFHDFCFRFCAAARTENPFSLEHLHAT